LTDANDTADRDVQKAPSPNQADELPTRGDACDTWASSRTVTVLPYPHRCRHWRRRGSCFQSDAVHSGV